MDVNKELKINLFICSRRLLNVLFIFHPVLLVLHFLDTVIILIFLNTGIAPKNASFSS